MTRKDYKGRTQKLVFSDEFNTAGRTFYDGDDPYFQAVDIWYGATQDLEVSHKVAIMKQTVLTIRSGTIPMPHTQRMAVLSSSSTLSRLTAFSIDLAWSSRGTSYATKVATWRPVSHSLGEVT
jgi:hypothetical protein